MKKTKKLSFQIVVLLNFEVFIIEKNFLAQYIILRLDYFIIDLFLKFLDILRILHINNYQLLKLGKMFFIVFNFK